MSATANSAPDWFSAPVHLESMSPQAPKYPEKYHTRIRYTLPYVGTVQKQPLSYPIEVSTNGPLGADRGTRGSTLVAAPRFLGMARRRRSSPAHRVHGWHADVPLAAGGGQGLRVGST